MLFTCILNAEVNVFFYELFTVECSIACFFHAKSFQDNCRQERQGIHGSSSPASNQSGQACTNPYPIETWWTIPPTITTTSFLFAEPLFRPRLLHHYHHCSGQIMERPKGNDLAPPSKISRLSTQTTPELADATDEASSWFWTIRSALLPSLQLYGSRGNYRTISSSHI